MTSSLGCGGEENLSNWLGGTYVQEPVHGHYQSDIARWQPNSCEDDYHGDQPSIGDACCADTRNRRGDADGQRHRFECQSDLAELSQPFSFCLL